MTPKRIYADLLAVRRTFTHDAFYDLLGRPFVPMPFLDGIDRELPPLLQCTRLASLHLQRVS